MKGSLKLVVAACVLVGAFAVGCKKPKPIQPSKPVPQGTLLFWFSRKVEGPLELTVDGVRIPVTRTKPGKKATKLTISGLGTGRHTWFILSPKEAFGPDQGEVELADGKGAFVFAFSQTYNSVLYGAPAPIPASEGLPGVKAVLEP